MLQCLHKYYREYEYRSNSALRYVRKRSDSTCRLGIPTPSSERRTMYQWTGDMLEERQEVYKSMREVQGGRVRRNAQLYKPLTQNIRVGCLVWYFDPRIIPGTSHKQTSFWAGPYQVFKLIALSLTEIKPVYYPGEEKLVSLDVLKLYCGEDICFAFKSRLKVVF